MGGLSRTRLKPRIVRKLKRKNTRNVSVTNLEERYRLNWTQKKTLTENFKDLGLRLSVNPNMKHSIEGQAIRKNK